MPNESTPEAPSSQPLPGQREIEREMARRTRRSLVAGGLASLAGFGLWEWIRARRLDLDQPWPLRRVLDINEELSRDYFSKKHLSAQYPPAQVHKPLRLNERIGMEDPLDPAEWKLVIDGYDTEEDEAHAELDMDAIRKLPRVEQVTDLKCIEGWSQKAHWAGARLADLAQKYPPPGGYDYVGLETPGAGYYVGLDLASATQPQTLLAYELDGEPLPEAHGAPLRLVIPVKYGIKNLKRIGRIFYSQERPRDFWAERGYDWYAGL